MAEMIVGFTALAIWLGSGGWAAGVLVNSGEEMTSEQMGSLAVLCIVLGPFMAGVALAFRRSQP